jgi:predicted transposase/invertase (TIGR01784 family)
MNENNKFVRFDWAAKRMLRDKANFGVLEGLLTVLLEEKITIEQILESESNQNSGDDKFNRVDIKALNSKGQIIIVEIQLTRQLYYLERILFGVSKAITEHITLGKKYDSVKKVYSINILYFDLGKGSDYLYHGKTSFIGVHTGDRLQVNTKEKNAIRMQTPEEIFPEYYIIRVNEFNKVATTPLEEWLEYLKDGNIRENTTAPGLAEARQKLQYLKMSRTERLDYDRHMDDIMVENDVLDTAKMEGRAEGRAEGIKATALKLKEMGLPTEQIMMATGMSENDLKNL